MKTKLDMRTIAVEKIIANQNNPRSEIGDTSDLEASIKAHGLISPITVRYNGKRFEVVAGSRRLQALHNLGIESVDCNVIDGPEDELFAIATAENVARRNMSPSDECKAIQKMVNDGKDIHNIAAEFGRTCRWVIGRLKMAELGNDILSLLDSGDITLAHAEVLTMCDNDEDIKRFASEAKYESPEELKSMIMAEKSNLSKAPFNVAKICKNCEKQTITQQDIFGDVTDSYCRDGKCYQQHVTELIEAKREECLDLGMIEVNGTDKNWSFNYRDCDWINVNVEHTEEEEEIIDAIKEAGKTPYFRIGENAEVTAKWYKYDKPSAHDDDDDDSDTNYQDPSEWERRREIERIVSRKEKEAIQEKVEDLLKDIPNETAALLIAALTNNTFDYTETDADGNEEEIEDSPLNHLTEQYTDHRHTDGLDWIQLLCEEVVDGLVDYDGLDERHREYFDVDHEKIVAEATAEYESQKKDEE